MTDTNNPQQAMVEGLIERLEFEHEYSGHIKSIFGDAVEALKGQQSLVTRLESMTAAQEVLIGEHIAKQNLERARLDFVIAKETTWYPGRAGNGYGVLCYDGIGRRAESVGKTMRDAIDAAMSAAQPTNGGE